MNDMRAMFITDGTTIFAANKAGLVLNSHGLAKQYRVAKEVAEIPGSEKERFDLCHDLAMRLDRDMAINIQADYTDAAYGFAEYGAIYTEDNVRIL